MSSKMLSYNLLVSRLSCCHQLVFKMCQKISPFYLLQFALTQLCVDMLKYYLCNVHDILYSIATLESNVYGYCVCYNCEDFHQMGKFAWFCYKHGSLNYCSTQMLIVFLYLPWSVICFLVLYRWYYYEDYMLVI